MKKIIFISNLDYGKGMSGGTRIYFEFIRHWNNILNIYFFGSKGIVNTIKKEGIKNINFIVTSTDDQSFSLSIIGIFKYSLKRLVSGIGVIKKNIKIIEQADYIYSVSDFYPDFLPAFWAKLKNKKIKWIAGYYLFAPGPFSKESPYKGKNRIRGFIYWLMQRPSYLIVKKCADIVFVTSEPDVKKFITKERARDKVIVVQGGVDITESEKYFRSGEVNPVQKRKYEACYVGRFHYQKGVIDLVDIWKKVCEKKQDAKLIMIGNGSLEKEVKDKIIRNGLEKNISLLGFVDGKRKYEVFKQSKIMVHPATYDSGGMAAAEGMAWGLPGVSYDLEALKTYYPKGMVKSKINDQDDFANNILKLLDNAKLYKKQSSDALSLIRDVWDWKKRSEKVYTNLIKASK